MKKLLCVLVLCLGVFAEARIETKSAYIQNGNAVFYGGRYDRSTRMTAAHLTLPFGTWVRVTQKATGRSILVKINDRGPFNGQGRIIDLSTTAARALGITRMGVARVQLEVVRYPARRK
jgi:rare lipoprotein A